MHEYRDNTSKIIRVYLFHRSGKLIFIDANSIFAEDARDSIARERANYSRARAMFMGLAWLWSIGVHRPLARDPPAYQGRILALAKAITPWFRIIGQVDRAESIRKVTRANQNPIHVPPNTTIIPSPFPPPIRGGGREGIVTVYARDTVVRRKRRGSYFNKGRSLRLLR